MIPRIRTVQIKNYKSLAAVSVRLEPFTVFVGPNGSGKSNFVDAIAFVQESVSDSIEVALTRRGGIAGVLNRSAGPISISELKPDPLQRVGIRLFIDLGENHEADYAFEIQAGIGGEFWVCRESCTVKGPSHEQHHFEIRDGKFVEEPSGIKPPTVSDRLALPLIAGTVEFRPLWDFLSKMRAYSIEPSKMRELHAPALSHYLTSDGSNAPSVLRSLKEQLPSNELEDVWKILSEVAHGIYYANNTNIGNKDTLIFFQEFDTGEREIFYPWEISDGTLRVLGLLLAVYQRFPRLVAIEEPEITVHPAIMEMIMDVLMAASQEKQVLITTHSPEILNQKGLVDEQLRLVTWQKGQTIISPPCDSLRDVIRDQLYMPGELLSMGELECHDGAEPLAPESLDLFGEPFQEEFENK